MIRYISLKYIVIVACFWWMQARVVAAELPQNAQEIHVGVASCASGVCHGSVHARTTTSVLQNEYVVWSRLDRHRTAYQTLLSEQSRWIAQNLGLANAHEADVCLDCHADNVAAEKRGERFQIDDGVGCEACHGGAENYLASHANPNQSHEQNLQAGLYPADRLIDRAALCLSCHVGNASKIASHRIMGAGHPRISFELDTFGVLQPAHYVIDDDYRSRKETTDSVTTWAVGQIEYARQTLGLIETHLDQPGMFPELSLFDCHACHHGISDQRWESQKHVGLPPGSVRLNDAGFVMLIAIAQTVDTKVEARLYQVLQRLHQSANNNDDMREAIEPLKVLIDDLQGPAISAASKSDELLRNIVGLCQKGSIRDYVTAEQAVMAIELLADATGEREQHADLLERLYKSVSNEDSFDAYLFVDVMNDWGKSLPSN